MNINQIFCHGLSITLILFFLQPTSLLANSYELNSARTNDATQQNWERLANNIPDIIVLDQDGKKLRFYTDLVKGKTVAINFVFTTCSSVCPILTEIFSNTRKILDERGSEQTQLISISVDPSSDTPQKLKEFATKFHAGNGWTFITADKAGIDRLLKALGAFSAKRDDHSTMVLIGNDADDRWTRSYGVTPATMLVQMLDEAQLHN